MVKEKRERENVYSFLLSLVSNREIQRGDLHTIEESDGRFSARDPESLQRATAVETSLEEEGLLR